MARCPFCAEEILDQTVTCPWCRSELRSNPEESRLDRVRARSQTVWRAFRRWPIELQVLAWVAYGWIVLIPLAVLGGAVKSSPGSPADRAKREQERENDLVEGAFARAVRSLVWGCISLPLSIFLFLPPVFAITYGARALKGLRVAGRAGIARGMAIAGIVLGGIGTLPVILYIAVVSICTAGGTPSSQCGL